MGKRKGYLSK